MRLLARKSDLRVVGSSPTLGDLFVPSFNFLQLKNFPSKFCSWKKYERDNIFRCLILDAEQWKIAIFSKIGNLHCLGEELDKFKCLEAKCREKPWKVRARTYGTKSPSRSEALRFIDSAKSPRWGFGWVDKAQCFRSARRFGAVGSSPDFSGFFTTFGF